MQLRRVASGMAAAVVALALIAPGRAAHAQTAPRAGSAAEQNASIVRPLNEIGRVRARTPYCAALAHARVGAETALAYEYQVPTLVKDLRSFRLDSELTRAHSLKKTENDLTALASLAQAGRDDVRALRVAATAEPDDKKRDEMLAFANALDGAKARQMLLAKSIARVVAILAERQIRTIVTTDKDDRNSETAMSGGVSRAIAMETRPSPDPITQAQSDAISEHERLQNMFHAFEAERFIRDDLKDAATHATTAMKLGGCTDTPT
jgi:hypothetical protein